MEEKNTPITTRGFFSTRTIPKETHKKMDSKLFTGDLRLNFEDFQTLVVRHLGSFSIVQDKKYAGNKSIILGPGLDEKWPFSFVWGQINIIEWSNGTIKVDGIFAILPVDGVDLYPKNLNGVMDERYKKLEGYSQILEDYRLNPLPLDPERLDLLQTQVSLTNKPKRKNRPKQDALRRVATAMYFLEVKEFLTIKNAAQRIHTTSSTIREHREHEDVKRYLELLRKDRNLAVKWRQEFANTSQRPRKLE